MKSLVGGFPLLLGSSTETQVCLYLAVCPGQLTWPWNCFMTTGLSGKQGCWLSLDSVTRLLHSSCLGSVALHSAVTLGCQQYSLQINLILLRPDNRAQIQKNVKLPVRDDVTVLPKKAAASNTTEKCMLLHFLKYFSLSISDLVTTPPYCESAPVMHTLTIHS